MVHYLRYHQWRKGLKHHYFGEDDEDSQVFTNIMDFADAHKRTRPKFLFLLFLSLLSCCLILTPHFYSSFAAFSHLYNFGVENDDLSADTEKFAPICSSIPNGAICCDRNSIRSDICMMKGDIRTNSASSSIFLYTPSESIATGRPLISGDDEYAGDEDGVIQIESIKPYTRKWETNTMSTIDELNLIVKRKSAIAGHNCDVRYDAPAVFFSTGGYTGNVYHEFNDGILPLYITSQHLKRKVVFVILEYHDWWLSKYGDVLSRLSDYPPIDFRGDNRTHCFPEIIAGLRIHDELTVDPSLMEGSKSIVDFRNLLDDAYRPRIRQLVRREEKKRPESSSDSESGVHGDRRRRPKLVVLSRNKSRAITNEKLMVKIAEKIGFDVRVLRPDRTTELAKIYRELNGSDAMIGVHGAAMTHFLFMRPGSVFIQIIPLGTRWAAQTYYGDPAKKLGLKYMPYEISPKESSLYAKYKSDDAVLVDPESVTRKGWEYTKKIYLDGQDVRLNIGRFRKRLDRAYFYCMARMK